MKKLLALILSLCVITSICFTVNATYGQADITTNGESIVDAADLLTDEEEALLTAKAENIISFYNFDVVILTTPSMLGKSREDFSTDFYDYNPYGVGDNYDGIMCMLSMEEREFFTMTTGSGQTIFADGTYELIYNSVVSDLSNANYYDAFDKALDLIESNLSAYANGESPLTATNHDENTGDKILMMQGPAILGSSVISGIIVLIFVLGMKNVGKKTLANEYINASSFRLSSKRDTFLYSRTTKTKIEKSSSGSRGGGYRSSGSFSGSSGRSHSGGGGRF